MLAFYEVNIPCVHKEHCERIFRDTQEICAGSLLSWPLWSCQGTEWAKEIVAVCLMLCDWLFREESERWAPSSVGRVGELGLVKNRCLSIPGVYIIHGIGLQVEKWSQCLVHVATTMEKRASCAISQIESPLVYFTMPVEASLYNNLFLAALLYSKSCTC